MFGQTLASVAIDEVDTNVFPGDVELVVVIAVEPKPDREPHEVLGVAKDAPEPVVKGAFCELVKDAHGDQGGNDAYDVSELKEARDAMLD